MTLAEDQSYFVPQTHPSSCFSGPTPSIPKARHIRICRRTTEKQQFRWPMTHSIYQNYLELIWFRGSNYFVNGIQHHKPTTLGGQQHFSKIRGGVKDQNRYSPFSPLSLFLSTKTFAVTRYFSLKRKTQVTVLLHSRGGVQHGRCPLGAALARRCSPRAARSLYASSADVTK